MSAVLRPAETVGGERVVVLHQITWDAYAAIGDALPDRRGLRMTFVDGRLTFLTLSRRHEWYAEHLGQLFQAVALGCGIELEVSGSAPYRQKAKDVGVEGDKVYYLGDHARTMRGPIDIDLATQPPPDLAIEVEVSHPADDALLVYGRLGVPEVWRLDVDERTLRFCLRNEDGSYSDSPRSIGLPLLESAEVLDRLRLAESLGWREWVEQLNRWVSDVILPRANIDR